MTRTWLTLCGIALATVASMVRAAEPGPAVTFTVDGAKAKPISPYIYGTNMPDWQKRPHLTLCRWGGNRITAYNWVTNASNAGSDWNHQNDSLLGRTEVPAEPVKRIITAAHAAEASVVVTVPTIGYVAADKKGDGDVNKTPDYLQKRFLISLPKKDAPFADTPSVADGKVYQGEFVNFLERAYPEARTNPARTIFYALDNEPDLWSHTHARIHPKKVTYDEVAKNNIAYAQAIKAVAPKALVFGFVSYGYHGFTTLQDAPDRNGRDFLDFYLQQMQQAEKQAGKRLIDVLDLHWYPEARGGNVRISEDDAKPAVAAARVQAPRSLWDPTYQESSWITNNVLHKPICLLPGVQEKIRKHYPGTKLALTEYYYGGGDHISGALAEADVLGIFGVQDVFAAALWHTGRTDDRFIYAAFAMYRDYDGKGGHFGDTSLAAQTSDVERTSIYASKTAQGQVVLVALNKSDAAVPVTIKLSQVRTGLRVEVYQLTAAAPRPVAGKELACQDGTIQAELPAQSVSTLVLTGP
jgi:hypothetical protein